MRRTKIQKKGKTKPFSMIDIVTKEDRNHIRSPTSYIYIFSPEKLFLSPSILM